jgi:hypothetical protein
MEGMHRSSDRRDEIPVEPHLEAERASRLSGSPILSFIAESGAWPFITRRLHRRADGVLRVWQSRHHRKGLGFIEPLEVHPLRVLFRLGLWMPGELNWWIGTVFALGSALFALGSLLALAPFPVPGLPANPVFFAGSIPFTIAAYLQLFQAANAPDPRTSARPRRAVLLGWRPTEIGWMSCALQFVGTLFFNINTFVGMQSGLSWWRQDVAIWLPDFLGSMLFLASGQLAFAETCHAYWAWQPRSLSWWITFTNLLGCVAFMISAFFAYVPRTPFPFEAGVISVVFTLLGALGFLAGSLLMLPEASAARERK